MPRNGSGTYSLPSGNPVVTGTTISSTVQNNTMSDVATALTNSIAKDGQTVPTANLPMGGFKLTGMGVGNANTDSATLGQIQDGGYILLASVSGTNTITAATSPITTAYVTGQKYILIPANTNSSTVTININSLGAKALTKGGSTALASGDIVVGVAYFIVYDGTGFQVTNIKSFVDSNAIIYGSSDATKRLAFEVDTNLSTATTRTWTAQDKNITPSGLGDTGLALWGCTLSTAGSSTTMSIAAGNAVDSTKTIGMTLSAIAKTTSAWAVGTAQGGLDTGAIANSTWYYFYVIRRPDTGVVDVVFSLSNSAPTLPTNYTQYRYIGAGFTNGSAQWTAFTQVGDEFYWGTPVNDFSGNTSTSAVTLALSVPRGRKVKAFVMLQINVAASSVNYIYVSDLANADIAPVAANSQVGLINGAAATASIVGNTSVWTNTSAQIRHREGAGALSMNITTLGWIDLRDRFA